MADPHQSPLPERAVVGVLGPDARSFLQGLLTQDTEMLAANELRYGALLTPQGRLRWDLFILGQEDGVLLDVRADQSDAIIQALTLYRLRAKVQITKDERAVAAAWGAAPEGEDWRPDPRLPALGWRRIGALGEGVSDYRAHRLALGVADPAEDTLEPLYPIDANLDLLGGIDFKKGCFVGQETTSRMKRRGQIKSRIAPLAYNGAPLEPGSDVMSGELRAGVVLTSLPGLSLALLRIDRASASALKVADRPVELDVPEWLSPYFALEPALRSETVQA